MFRVCTDERVRDAMMCLNQRTFTAKKKTVVITMNVLMYGDPVSLNSLSFAC